MRLLPLARRWGFVPNGARTYYTNRSQPPLLGAMVLAVWEHMQQQREKQHQQGPQGPPPPQQQSGPHQQPNYDQPQGPCKGGQRSAEGQRAGTCVRVEGEGSPGKGQGPGRDVGPGDWVKTEEGSWEGPSGDPDAFLREALPSLLLQHRYWTTGPRAVRLTVGQGSAEGLGADGVGGSGSGADGSGAGEAGAGARAEACDGVGKAEGRGVQGCAGWQGAGQHGCVVGGGEVFELSRYYAALDGPRPESFRWGQGAGAGAGGTGPCAGVLVLRWHVRRQCNGRTIAHWLALARHWLPPLVECVRPSLTPSRKLSTTLANHSTPTVSGAPLLLTLPITATALQFACLFPPLPPYKQGGRSAVGGGRAAGRGRGSAVP